MSTQIEQFTKAPNPLDDQEVFDVDMATYVTETLRFVTQANALGSEMQNNADVAAALILAMALPQFAGTSTSSVTVGTGTRTFETQAGKGWLLGQIVVASSGANYVKGTVTDYTGTDLELNVTSINGSGTYAAWNIGLSYEGLSLAKSGDNEDITRLKALTSAVSEVRQIQPISAVANTPANALTISASALSLEFRSVTPGSGAVSFVKGTPANLVISSGSTLGTVSGQQSRIVVLALNNAGTIELAAVNLAGGNDLSETGVISTTAEGGAGAADSASVIYSATARSNVAYRMLGYIESTQATAGTWVTAPSTVQGQGGQALAAMGSLGYGQTWQNVIGSRANVTTYYNTTLKPIVVAISFWHTTGSGVVTVNGLTMFNGLGRTTYFNGTPVTFIVPPGGSYSVSLDSLFTWLELR